jgi:hypothetical protein
MTTNDLYDLKLPRIGEKFQLRMITLYHRIPKIHNLVGVNFFGFSSPFSKIRAKSTRNSSKTLLPSSAQAPALAGLSLALISISPHPPGKVGKLEIEPQLVYHR